MSLRDRLAARIVRNGPMPVSEFMIACLHDPEDGYYATRPALGERGDFITAPHVSQMFGEILGLWAAELWARLGKPARVRLVELGPGDGLLIGDVMRAARIVPGFRETIEVWLVETSTPLRCAQAAVLGETPARWVKDIEDLPQDLPCILLGNEFLDCLPIEQWVGRGRRRVERRVGLDAGGALAFVHEGRPSDHDAVFEYSPALASFGRQVGSMIAEVGGGALFIDYGSADMTAGDTLQAIRRHCRESALAHPGEADLTARVHFPTFLDAARAAGARTAPLETQGDFLRRLGIERRAATLARANPQQAQRIQRQLRRLADPEEMGELFKVACVHSPDITAP
jgi:SAM-dependent MidA family methyltransferase